MGPAEYDRLGPGDLRDLMEAWSERQRREDLRAGMICETLANCHRDPKVHPFPWQAADFFPTLWPLYPAPTEEDLFKKACAIFGIPPPKEQ